MRHCWAILILGAVTSCASHQPEALALELESLEPAAALEPLRGEPYASEDPPEPQPECLPQGFVARLPTVASYAEPSAGACRSIARSTRRQLSEYLREDWFYSYDNGRLEIDFGCDRLEGIEEITVQYGDGHGGTLDLVRLRRSADGLDWELLRLRYSAGMFPDPDELGPGVWRGRVGAAELERALDRSRAALVLEAEEHAADETIVSLTSTSGDFHAFLRLVDERGHARMVRFTGYPSSDAQLEWRIASLAVGPLADLVAAARVELVQPARSSWSASSRPRRRAT